MIATSFYFTFYHRLFDNDQPDLDFINATFLASIIGDNAYGLFKLITSCTVQYDEQKETDWYDHYRTAQSTHPGPNVQAGGLIVDFLGWLGVVTAGLNTVKYNKSKFYWFEGGYFIGLTTGRLTKMVLSTFFPKSLIRPTKPWERYWDLVASEKVFANSERPPSAPGSSRNWELSLDEADIEDDAAVEDLPIFFL